MVDVEDQRRDGIVGRYAWPGWNQNSMEHDTLAADIPTYAPQTANVHRWRAMRE